MNPARVSESHGRAVLLVTGLLTAAGALAVYQLPGDIYPPLKFPRVIVIAHVGTIPGRSMMLTVTRGATLLYASISSALWLSCCRAFRLA